MKTVLSLDEDAADLLRAHAEKRGVSLGAAASELIRKGARQTVTVKPGFVVRKKGQLRSPE
jgi:histone H3/H4